MTTSHLGPGGSWVTVADTPADRQYPVSGASWAQNTMVCLGDSWTHRLGQQTAPNAFTQSTSFHAWANAYKGGALQFVNAGVSGNTTAQMLARYSTDVTPYTGKWLHVLGGINDVAGDVAEATTIANLSAILALARGEGRIVIIGTVAPSGTTTTQARRQALNRINSWIRSLASESVRVADYYSGVVDQAGAQRSGVFVGDALHLSAKGGSICGLILHEATPDIPPRAQVLSNSVFEADNGLPCGEMNGNNASGSNNFTTLTGFTGTGPRGWTWYRTGAGIVATVSKQARVSSKFAADYARAVVTTTGADFDAVRLERLIAYRTWSSGGNANSVRRFVNLTTGAQYDVVADGNFAVGADPTASWPTTPGAVFTDGTATLVCIKPLNVGGTYQVLAECNISAVTVGTVQPVINCSLMNSAGTVQCTTYGMYHDVNNGTMAASADVGSGLVLTSPTLVVPAGFDLSATTSSGGPQVRTRLELHLQGGALATVDWARATIRHG